MTPSFVLQPAEERWAEAVSASLNAVPFELSFAPVFAAHNQTLFNNISDAAFQRYVAYFPSQHFCFLGRRHFRLLIDIGRFSDL